MSKISSKYNKNLSLLLHLDSWIQFSFLQVQFHCKELKTGIISSAESQKGTIADQRCSVENQKGATAIDFVQQ